MRKIKFWRMGTGHGSYVEKIDKYYQGVDSFARVCIDRKRIEAVDNANNRVLYTFTSSATARQFLVVGEALGFFEYTENGIYKVLTTHYDYERVTRFIFKIDDCKDIQSSKEIERRKDIQRYRDSRIICCLACLDLLDLFDFTKDVEMERSKKEANKDYFASEKSLWETDTVNDCERAKEFLRMVKKWQQ